MNPLGLHGPRGGLLDLFFGHLEFHLHRLLSLEFGWEVTELRFQKIYLFDFQVFWQVQAKLLGIYELYQHVLHFLCLLNKKKVALVNLIGFYGVNRNILHLYANRNPQGLDVVKAGLEKVQGVLVRVVVAAIVLQYFFQLQNFFYSIELTKSYADKVSLNSTKLHNLPQ